MAENKARPFVGFVLLETPEWNTEKFAFDLKNDWDISYNPNDTKNNIITLEFDNMLASISFMNHPVPEGEAEENAKANYLWPKAVEAAEKHTAHIMVAIVNYTCLPIEAAKVYTKLVSTCLKQDNALGVYTTGNVFSPRFYCGVAEMMKSGELPVPNWVYLGLYRTEEGMCGYTYGLADFGFDEIEVLNTKAQPQDLHNFLLDVAYYIISKNVTLKDGETIGFTPEQQLAIKKSGGVALNGLTLKIEYPEN